jgi:hypothetical protein
MQWFQVKMKIRGGKSYAGFMSQGKNVWTKERLKTNLYDKRDDFTFSIVIFPFIGNNIPASPAYGVYISKLIR